MKRIMVAAAVIAVGVLGVNATGSLVNPNGFPSGTHFNLNIHGKRADFKCPAPEFDLVTGQQLFGNVISVPRVQGGDPISILFESGKKGPRSAPLTSALEVTDWCTESFPDFGAHVGDGASVRLPAHAAGYKVYARITGKPGDSELERTFKIAPSLAYAMDEFGNDLLYLGLVSSTGVFDTSGVLIPRTSDLRKGKSVLPGTDISGLFKWSGDVCYLPENAAGYCVDPLTGADLCTQKALCCIDEQSDGIYDRCDDLAQVGVDPEGDGLLSCPLADAGGNTYLALSAECRTYSSEWVFNIADFVGVLWNIDTTGAYTVQVRFYPQ